MATIYLSLSAKADTTNKKEILIRFIHGKINQRGKTNIFIKQEHWDNENQQIIIPNFRLMNAEQAKLKQYLNEQKDKLKALTIHIDDTFTKSDKSEIASDWLKTTIDRYNFPKKYEPIIEVSPKQTFFDAFDEFMMVKKFSEWRNKAFKVVIRAMKRYELYIQLTKDKSFSFDF
ncbi:MAG: hypothetical protein LBI45_08740, partial [Bacteroidales bacterium]|nr:hypothetical protein [Bacteroidales bacterium]